MTVEQENQEQQQPKDLSTPERLATTAGAVAQGIKYTIMGDYETQGGVECRWSASHREVSQRLAMRTSENLLGARQNRTDDLLIY